MAELTVSTLIPNIGEGVSFAVGETIKFLAGLGVGITESQTKILSMLFFGIIIYLLLSVLTIGNKLLKWVLVGLFLFFIISVLSTFLV